MYGDGSTSRDYTYVDDIVKGVLSAVNYDQSLFQIINLGNNYSVSLKELISSVEEVVGKKALIDQQEEQAGDVPQTFADISKAKQLLNYQPTTQLKDGLLNFYNWFLKNKEILFPIGQIILKTSNFLFLKCKNKIFVIILIYLYT